MGCNACIKNNEEGSMNMPENTKMNIFQFMQQFDKFLKDSEYEKIKEEEMNSHLPKNYSNEQLTLPSELVEKDNLYNMEPIKFKNGNIFKGKWNEGNKIEGIGKYYIKNDDIFIEGFWDNGELKFGRIYMPNGNIYEGYIKDSKFNGKGKFILQHAEYEGIFENDNFKNGKMVWKNGYEYEGDFNGYCLQGKGKLKGPNGDIYEGNFSDNLFNGEGKYIYKSGNLYEGEFQYGFKKGKGKYTSNNEYIYDGIWDNDMPFGYGKYSNWDNTLVFKCLFRDGKIAEEPIYEIGSAENFNQNDFEIKPEEMKINFKELLHLNISQNDPTQFKLGSFPSFLME